ncbi:hypothetical protein P9112_006094 [Eukaryota sp. TZLM1-RC]
MSLSTYLHENNVAGLFRDIVSALITLKPEEPAHTIVQLLENQITAPRIILPSQVSQRLDRLLMFSIDPQRFEIVQNVRFFSFLDPFLRQDVALNLQLRSFSKDEVIITQGHHDPSPSFFIVEQGSVDFFSEPDGESDHQARNHKGTATRFDYFGELSSLTSPPRPRACTVVAKEDGTLLWELDHDTFTKHLAPVINSLRSRISPSLSKVALFSGLDEYVRTLIADWTELRTFETGSEIVVEGDLGKEFFVILEGNAMVLKNDQGQREVIGELHGGDYFGELALLYNHSRFATVIASTLVVCAEFGSKMFRKLIDRTNCLEIMQEKVSAYGLEKSVGEMEL